MQKIQKKHKKVLIMQQYIDNHLQIPPLNSEIISYKVYLVYSFFMANGKLEGR